MFEQRHKYGISTFYSKHPSVNAYIGRIIGDLKQWLLDDVVEKLVVVIYNDDAVLVRYAFDICVVANEDTSAVQLASLDNQLRGHLRRVIRQQVSGVAGGEKRFEYVAHTKGVRTGGSWMVADGGERGGVGDTKAVPLKDADRASTTALLSSRAEMCVNGDKLSAKE